MLASPAVRVRQTLAQFARGYGQPFDVQFEAGIYESSAGGLLALLRRSAGEAARVLLVGHNPALHALAVQLSGDPALAAKFPTAALAEIALPIGTWREIGRERGTLRRFVRPRELD